MPRGSRIVVPGVPHHITQRGNRKQAVFYEASDYRFYLDLLKHYSSKYELPVLAYCLMPNHVHVVSVPQSEDHLRTVFAPIHTMQAQEFNRKQDTVGHVWQGRFSSIALDDSHLVAALRYVELNPVRAGLVRQPEEWEFSSSREHLKPQFDIFLSDHPVVQEIGDWRAFLESGLEQSLLQRFRLHERNGLPLGDDAFLDTVESTFGRSVRPRKKGRPKGWRKHRA